MNRLSLLKRNEIDTQKWDALIDSSVQSLPYAYTWYLDAVAENWDALVIDDYKAVFPLPWVRKLGFKCLYQPYYCQQLGFFSSGEPDAALLKHFFEELQQFPYININLNSSAKIIAVDLSIKKKKNLLLPLDKEYATLRKKFSENHRRNISKAEKTGLHFLKDVGLDRFQQFYLQNINRKKENFKTEHEAIFKKLTATITSRGAGKIFAASGAEGELTTAVLLLFHHNRAINIINTSSTEGKKNGSSHFLFNNIIQEFASANGAPWVLDFEGSSVPGIARFYEGFGAHEEVFYNYHTSLVKKLSQRFR